MQSIAPAKRESHFDTALHIYGVQRKEIEEIKISFVVQRRDWRQFRNDLETYGMFKEFDSFTVDGQSIQWFGPIRGCILARGTKEENDQLLTYVEDHPAFNGAPMGAPEPKRGLNLVKGTPSPLTSVRRPAPCAGPPLNRALSYRHPSTSML